MEPDDPAAVPAASITAQPEVREALKEASPATTPHKQSGRLLRLLLHGAGAAVLVVIAFLARGGELGGAMAAEWIYRVLVAGALTLAYLAVYEIAAYLVLPRIQNPAARFNVRRVMKLVVALLLVLSLASLFFVGWYGAAVSVGVVSLILGLALQTPITSFFAWIFILVRRPYRVGDRIRIGEATGDVIDVSYLDTTLWEFGGEFLSSDHPSGRLIKFPNSLVLSSTVYNYSWPLFPYIWNEITMQIAYESDLDFVASTLRRVVEEERGRAMTERINVYRGLLARTPVDELEVDERPSVLFRTSANTWIEATVRYLVAPRRAGRVKTALTRKILTELNQAPDKVLFPKANLR
ncbi:MAG: mechanosensitive ion channel family protein [Thermoanaerobaculia bacterium]